MKQIVFQIAKNLNIFTIDEVALIAECNDIENILTQLIGENKVVKLENGKYKAINRLNFPKKRKEKNQIYFTQPEIENLQEQRKTLTYLHPRILSKIDKYMQLLIKANNFKGTKLKNYINNVWNVENPDMKSSVTTFRRNRK